MSQLNDEANVSAFDPASATHMTQVGDSDIADSRELSGASWHDRSCLRMLRDRMDALTDAQIQA